MPKVELPQRESEISETPNPSLAPKVRRRWWPRILLLLIVVALLLPSGLSIFGQIPVILRKVHPKLASVVQFRTIHLHWWAPVEIHGLVVTDVTKAPSQQQSLASGGDAGASEFSEQTNPISGEMSISESNSGVGSSGVLLSAEVVKSREPLWKILVQMGQGISVDLQRPVLNLSLDESGSNLQKTIDEVVGKSEATSESLWPVRITVTDGRASLQSSVSVAGSSPGVGKSTTRVGGINGTFSTLDAGYALPELHLQAFVQSDVRALGVSGKQTPADAAFSGSLGSGTAVRDNTVNPRLAANLDDLTSEFSLAPLDGFDQSAFDQNGLSQPGVSQDSAQTSHAQEDSNSETQLQIAIGRNSEDTDRQSIRIATRQLDLRLLHPLLNYYASDLICDGQVSGVVQAELAGRELTDGIVGRFLLDGQQVRVRNASWSAGEWLLLGDTKASGAAAIAVDGLLLKDITVGSDVMNLTGNGELRHAGSSNVSVQPLGSGSVAESAVAGGDVAGGDITAGAKNSAELRGSIDVARIAQMLPATLALRDDVRIERGKLVFGIRGELVADEVKDANRSSRWQASLQNDRIEATRAGKPVALDPALRLDAVGPIARGLPSIAQARVTGGFGSVEVSPQGDGYQITGAIQPDQLWQQVQQFIDVPRPGIRGQLTLQSKLTIHADHYSISDLQFNSSDLKVSSSQLQIYPDHPLHGMLQGALHVEGSGAAIRTLVAPWHSATWLAGHAGVLVDVIANPSQAIRLQARVQPSPVAAAVRSSVRSVSQSANHNATGMVSGVAASADISSFQVDEATVDIQLQNVGGGSTYQIQSGRILLPGIAAQMTGSVGVAAVSNTAAGNARMSAATGGSPATGQQVAIVDLTAEAEYDLNVLCSRLLPPDSPLRLNGRGRGTWRVTGAPSVFSMASLPRNAAFSGAGNEVLPSVSPLRITGGVSWQSGELWGLPLGGATVQAVLDNGIVKTQPIQCSLGTGEINAMPQFDVVNQRLQLATGSRVENLSITPELCREWLGYLAPMLADSANVRGLLSARVEQLSYLLNQPAASDITATVTIHQAEASPGSSLLSLLETIDLLRRAGNADRSSLVRSVVLPQQQVSVQMRQGFIIHQGLVVELSGYQASSSGAVGMNRQLQIDLDIPLDKTSVASNVRTIRIPLRGTIDAPQPDTAGLLQNLGTQTIERKLNNTLDKQLNKLLDRF